MRLTGTTIGFVAVMTRRDLRGSQSLAAFITGDGMPLDSQPVMIGDHFDDAYAFAVVGNGNNAFIAWARTFQSPTDSDIYGTLVDGATGETRASVLVSRSTASQVSPALATDGEAVIAVWSEATQAGWQIRTARIAPSGADADARTIHPSAQSQVQPAVAFNGTDYLVVWHARHLVKRLDKFGSPRDDVRS